MKINDMMDVELKGDLTKKIVLMMQDAGQKIDDDSMTHIISRMANILKVRFRSFEFDDVLKAFDNGAMGAYNGSTRITVNNLLSWIYKRKKEIQESKVINNDDIHERIKYLYSKKFETPSKDDFASFITWLTSNSIWIDDLINDMPDVNHNDDIPLELRELHGEWKRHLSSGTLLSFKRTLKKN